MKPATAHLTQPVVVSLGSEKYVAGVGGAKLTPEFLQRLLMEASEKTSSEGSSQHELSCANSTELLCYFIDRSAHVIASNQVSKRE